MLSADDGDDEMRAVSDPIREGAQGTYLSPQCMAVPLPNTCPPCTGFLKVQYTAISKLAVVVAVAIFGSYKMRPSDPYGKGIDSVNTSLLGLVGAISFILVRTARHSPLIPVLHPLTPSRRHRPR